MSFWEHLISIGRQMMREPRPAAAALSELSLALPRGAVMTAFLVIVAISVIVTEPLLAVATTMFAGDPPPPLVRAIGSALGGLAITWMIWKIGGFMQGRARFDQVFLGFVFLEGIFVLGIVALLLMVTLVPAIAGLMGLVFVGFWLWLFANVVAELHGFPSAWKAFGVVVLSWVIVNYASIFVLNLISGLAGGPSNV